MAVKKNTHAVVQDRAAAVLARKRKGK